MFSHARASQQLRQTDTVKAAGVSLSLLKLTLQCTPKLKSTLQSEITGRLRRIMLCVLLILFPTVIANFLRDCVSHTDKVRKEIGGGFAQSGLQIGAYCDNKTT